MLTAAQKQQFADDGYVFIDPEIDGTTIDGVVERVGHGLFGTNASQVHGKDPQRPGSGRVQDAWNFDDGVKRIARAPAILTQLADLYGRPPKPFQTLNFRIGTQQLAHSDTVHFNCFPQGFMCGVWVALEDIDETNGAVVYYPGSHKLPEFNLTHVCAESDLASQREISQEPSPWSPAAIWRRIKGSSLNYSTEKDYSLYEQFIQRQIAKFRLNPALATMKKGSAFIWAANLLHGGSPHADPNRTRHSQVIHYYFEGCRYHRPLLHSNAQVHYFEPAWIL